jgi:hypothetical protein
LTVIPETVGAFGVAGAVGDEGGVGVVGDPADPPQAQKVAARTVALAREYMYLRIVISPSI